jgi:asparagine synthase (glutamine-hydrolysing)
MSAIFGIIDFLGRPLEDSWIESMQRDLAHRGPDGQGLYREPSVALGHMLLQVTPESIYDKSPYEEDGMVITAYARLDEREAIMDRIGTPIYEREKLTDPLLLLRSFRKFGKDFVKDIYGDCAFAIWDEAKKELFCVRDQMGVKPFLYYFQDDIFVFSSELKSIVKLQFIETTINHNYLKERVVGIRSELQQTGWTNVQRLKAANHLNLVENQLKILNYWEPRYIRNELLKCEHESAQALKSLLEKVICDHIRIKGDAGAHLSGGLDSSTLVCIAAKQLAKYDKSLTTVSSVYEGNQSDKEPLDEKVYIDEVIRQEKNINAKFVYHSNLGFWKGLQKTLNNHFAPVFTFYYVDEALCHKFQSNKVRRVLCGHPGDITVTNSTIQPFEFLLCSGRFLAFYKLLKRCKSSSKKSLFNIIKTNIIIEFCPLIILRWYGKIKNSENEYTDVIRELPFLFQNNEIIELRKRYLNHTIVHSRKNSDLTRNIWPQDLDLFEEDKDCGTSHFQIEQTYPLADRRLVELLLTIPVEHYYSEGLFRGLVRKAMLGTLPEKIRLRMDKGDYSPGHSEIFRKDIPLIIQYLENIPFDVKMNYLIDFKKLKILLATLLKQKKNIIFVRRDWVLIELFIWIYFNNLIRMEDEK